MVLQSCRGSYDGVIVLGCCSTTRFSTQPFSGLTSCSHRVSLRRMTCEMWGDKDSHAGLRSRGATRVLQQPETSHGHVEELPSQDREVALSSCQHRDAARSCLLDLLQGCSCLIEAHPVTRFDRGEQLALDGCGADCSLGGGRHPQGREKQEAKRRHTPHSSTQVLSALIPLAPADTGRAVVVSDLNQATLR